MAIPEDSVAYPTTAYLEHIKRTRLVTTLMEGTEAMKAAGQEFLPKEPEESQAAYNVRLARTYLLNAYRRTILYLGGQVFARPMILQDDVPQEIKDISENIDNCGNNIDVFCKKVFEAGITEGTTCILVDYPPAPTDITKEQEKKIGLRPYWVHIPVSSILGCQVEVRDGKTIFTQIRIKESVEKPKGKFGTEQVTRIRVINLGSYQVYEDISDGREKDWKKIEDNLTSFTDQIPLVVFQPGDRLTALTARPPLEDLAALNLAHYQSNSDQVNILHHARVPILFGKLLADDPTKIVVGPNRMIHANNADASLEYVEHTGQAIGSGRENLDDIEQLMALYGLQLLLPKTGRITATEKALSSGENDCTLKTWALQFKDAVETALLFTAKWMRLEKGGSAVVNTEYRMLMTADADVLIKAKMAGILPRHTVLQEFLRRGIISEDSDLSAIEELFMEENSNSFSSFSGLLQ